MTGDIKSTSGSCEKKGEPADSQPAGSFGTGVPHEPWCNFEGESNGDGHYRT